MHPSEKVVPSLEELAVRCNQIRNNRTIVLTSGCFDLLHGGHLEYLCEAGSKGSLVVGINSDAFVKRLKGESRPVRNQEDRAFVMAGFSPVGLVVIFDCDYALIEAVKPNIYIASNTSKMRIWEDKERVALLEKYGTEIIELGGIKKDSTTDIILRATA